MDIDVKAQVSIRKALPTDFDAVIALDDVGITEGKPNYWRGIFDRFVDTQRADRILLVAERDDRLVGFIGGEVRAWEFGSPPCGWVFAMSVLPDARGMGIGQFMFREMCQRLKQAGVETVRTMVARENKLNLSFFRSQGLRTGRYIELEKSLDDI